MQNDLYFYLILLGIILIGFAWLSPGRKGSEANPDIGKLLADRQNRELLQMVSELKQEMETNMNAYRLEIEELKRQLAGMPNRQAAAGSGGGSAVEDRLQLAHRYAEIFQLRQQGRSTKEIANALDMGTGEVELILQLHSLSSLERNNPKGGAA